MSSTDLHSHVTGHSLPPPSDALQNASIHEMKPQFDLLEESMPPSLPLTRSHTTTPNSYRHRLSSRKRIPWSHHTRQKFEILMDNLVPIYFIPPRTLNFQRHEAILNRLGLWDFIHLKFDVPISHDLLVELISTYNHSKRCSFVSGKRVDMTRAKLASAMKLRVKKRKLVMMHETGSAEGNGTSLSADSVAFLDEFLCNWILLHDDIWIMPPEVVEARSLVEKGQPLMVDWAGLLWLMVEKEILQGRKLVHFHYASHLMCLLKSQVQSLFSDVRVRGGGGDAVVEHKDGEIIEEMGVIQAGENEEGDGCEEDDKISADEEGDVQMEEQGEGDHTVTDDTEKQEHDGEEREDNVEEDENDQEATKSHGMEVQSMDLSLIQIENKDCLDEISADFENDMPRNIDLVPCLAVEEHHLRRCITGEEREIEIGENKLSGKCGTSITPTDGFSPIPSMFAGHSSSGAAMEQDKYPSKLMFGTQLSSSTDISIPLMEETHKRLRADDDMENTFVCDDYDTYFEHIQLLLRRWKSASESKHREFEETIMGQECLLREIHHRDSILSKLCRDSGEELQKKQAEVHRLERELLQMEHLLAGYRDALSRCRAAFEEYIVQHPQTVEPLYKDVDGGDGLVLKAVEVRRMEVEKEENEKLMISVEKMVMEVEEEWCGKMDEYLQQADLLNKRLKEKVIDIADIKELFARRKALNQQASSSPV